MPRIEPTPCGSFKHALRFVPCRQCLLPGSYRQKEFPSATWPIAAHEKLNCVRSSPSPRRDCANGRRIWGVSYSKCSKRFSKASHPDSLLLKQLLLQCSARPICFYNGHFVFTTLFDDASKEYYSKAFAHFIV